MMQTFVQTIPGILQEMKTCLLDKNWEKLSKLAHQIKPSFTLMGITDLRTTILFIEENGKNNTNLTELSKITHDFIHACMGLINDFTRELPSR
jgi:HPt (histidine-containing phosphotransfer) domain-containing protein